MKDVNEIIQTLKVAKAEVEWEYPLDYALAIEYAIKAIKDVEERKTKMEEQEKILDALRTLKHLCKNSSCKKCMLSGKDQYCLISKCSPCDWILNEETKEWKAFKD